MKLASLLVLAIVAACTPEVPPNPEPPGPTTVDVDDPAGLCAAFVSCAGKASPGSLGMILEAYGKDGSCWKAQSTSFCRDACANGIAALHQTKDVAECNVCLSDADCPERFGARCDTSTHQCFGCLADSDCVINVHGRLCNTSRRACVECWQDQQCDQTSGHSDRCDLSSGACVECLDASDCFNVGEGGCVQHTCAPCTADADCNGLTAYPFCVRGACVSCRSQSDCSNHPDGHYCRDNVCICRGDADCNPSLKCPPGNNQCW